MFFNGCFFKYDLSKKTAYYAILQRIVISILSCFAYILFLANKQITCILTFWFILFLLLKLIKNENFILQGVKICKKLFGFKKLALYFLNLLIPLGDFHYLLKGETIDVYGFIQPQKNFLNGSEEIRLLPLIDSINYWWHHSYKNYENEINI